MPDTMIERVARALCKAAGDHPDSLYAGPPIDEPVFLSSGAIQPTLGWHKYVPEARAAITAMREPTEAMDLSACKVTTSTRYGDGSSVPVAVWEAMIDAALTEG